MMDDCVTWAFSRVYVSTTSKSFSKRFRGCHIKSGSLDGTSRDRLLSRKFVAVSE